MNRKLTHKALPAILVFLAFFVISSSAWAATYYVDATSGNDGNDGLSPTNAWKTIAKVNASNFNPGDQILFKRGEIWREQLDVPATGLKGNPITFAAYGSGDAPIITGGYFGIVIENRSYIIVENIEIRAVTGTDGIIIRNGSEYITLNNIISSENPDYGVRIESHNVIVDGGLFYNNLKLGGIGVYNAENITIKNAIIYNNTEDGIWADNATSLLITGNTIFNHINNSGLAVGSPDGIQIKNSGSITISNNLIYDCQNAGIIIGNTSGGSIRNNIIFNAHGALTFTYTKSGSFEIYNNTLFKSVDDELLFLSPIDNATFIVRNNIFRAVNGRAMRVADGVDPSFIIFDHNLYYTEGTDLIRYNSTSYTIENFTDYQNTSSQDANSIASNPLFVVSLPETAEEFKLKSESPCIGTGIDVGLTTDFFGKEILDLPDIGAVEFQKIDSPKNLRILLQ